jgi:hypothetical protein
MRDARPNLRQHQEVSKDMEIRNEALCNSDIGIIVIMVNRRI